jgi:hypothetical protein
MNTSPTRLDAPQLQALVERYFSAVDRGDLAATLACFAPTARFGIAIHELDYQGRDAEVRGMFERLAARYARVWHGDFDHVIDVPHQRQVGDDVSGQTHFSTLLRCFSAISGIFRSMN